MYFRFVCQVLLRFTGVSIECPAQFYPLTIITAFGAAMRATGKLPSEPCGLLVLGEKLPLFVGPLEVKGIQVDRKR
jgi:hypothetical protein